METHAKSIVEQSAGYGLWFYVNQNGVSIDFRMMLYGVRIIQLGVKSCYMVNDNDKIKLREGLIPRDIDEVFFLVDIYEKKYYMGKDIFKMNRSGYELTKILTEIGEAAVSLVLEKFIDLFENGQNEHEIKDDVFYFLNGLAERGYLFVNGKIRANTLLDNNGQNACIQGRERGGLPKLVETYWSRRRHIYSVGIELTTVCNFKCVHCYNQNEDHSVRLSTQDIINILDQLYENGVLLVYFTGGEILTRPDFLIIYMYAKEKGFIVELLSNGSLISEDIIKVFDKYPPAVISVSLYGSSKESYERVTSDAMWFDKVCYNLSKLKESGLYFEVKFIGLRENNGDFKKAREIAENLGAKFRYGFEIFPALHGDKSNMSHMLSPEEIICYEKQDLEMGHMIHESLKSELLTPEEKGKGVVPLYLCAICKYMVLIDYQGFIQPCTLMRQRQFNILEDDLYDAWEGFAGLQKIMAEKNYKCRSCKNYKICNPCVEKNRLFTGNPTIPSGDHCRLIQYRVEEFSKEKYANT